MDVREYSYLRCRAIAHRWEDHQPLGRSRQGAVLTFRCAQCGMVRRDVMSRATGQLVNREYTPPKRYKDEARTKDDYRKAYVDALASNQRAASR